MATLAELLRDLERALTQGDQESAQSVRRTIVDGHPDSVAAAEAAYRMGLSALFGQRDMEAASTWMRRGAQSKIEPWASASRVALGVFLARLGKTQQAAFELRKVASGTPVTALSLQAAGLLVLAFRDAGQREQAERAREKQLELLARHSSGPGELGALASYMLGMEHLHAGDRKRAGVSLHRALDSGFLPPDQERSARRAVDDL